MKSAKPRNLRLACQIAFSLCLAAWIALIPAPARFAQALLLLQGFSGSAFAASGYSPGRLSLNDLCPETLLAGPPAALALPDLRTMPLKDLYIQSLSGGRRLLRLENTVWNSGQGPLELSGEFNPTAQRTRVTQHIYTGEGDPCDVLVGEFVWHSTHAHWHFDELTLYELWTITPDLRLGEVVSSSEKISYCMRDTDVIAAGHPRFSPRRGYWGCDQHHQGLSVGWGDTYKSTFDGQSLDITRLPYGFYALTSTANPNGAILEEREGNNTARVYLEIMGDGLAVVTLKEIRLAQCDLMLCK